jgi:hypothetical protein
LSVRPLMAALCQIRTSQHNAHLDQFEKPLQQVATTAIAVGLALAGNPDHADGLGTERREGVAQWCAGNLHQTRKWLTQLQD